VYVVRRFVEVAANNNKAFMELLFWKTNKEAIELVEGYGSYNRSCLWTYWPLKQCSSEIMLNF